MKFSLSINIKNLCLGIILTIMMVNISGVQFFVEHFSEHRELAHGTQKDQHDHCKHTAHLKMNDSCKCQLFFSHNHFYTVPDFSFTFIPSEVYFDKNFSEDLTPTERLILRWQSRAPPIS